MASVRSIDLNITPSVNAQVAMGDIPATTNMVSTVLTNPVGGCIAANKDFDVQLQVANLNAGVFTNPTVTYYSAPQALKNGKIIGHVHVHRPDS